MFCPTLNANGSNPAGAKSKGSPIPIRLCTTCQWVVLSTTIPHSPTDRTQRYEPKGNTRQQHPAPTEDTVCALGWCPRVPPQWHLVLPAQRTNRRHGKTRKIIPEAPLCQNEGSRKRKTRYEYKIRAQTAVTYVGALPAPNSPTAAVPDSTGRSFAQAAPTTAATLWPLARCAAPPVVLAALAVVSVKC